MERLRLEVAPKKAATGAGLGAPPYAFREGAMGCTGPPHEPWNEGNDLQPCVDACPPAALVCGAGLCRPSLAAIFCATTCAGPGPGRPGPGPCWLWTPIPAAPLSQPGADQLRVIPASLTKLMTLYPAVRADRAGAGRRCPGQDQVLATRPAPQPSRLEGGGRQRDPRSATPSKALIVKSANDVVIAVAEQLARQRSR